MAVPVHNRRGVAQRALLLAAAARCFSREAYDKVSMDDIAAEAAVSRPSLFYYFKSKRDCYLAVIEDFSTQLLAGAEIGPEHSFDEIVRHLIGVYLDFAERSEPAYRTLMSGGLGNDPQARAFVATERAKFHELFTRLGELEDPEPPLRRIAIEGFLSFMEGATLDWLEHRDVSREALTDLFFRSAALFRQAEKR